MTVWQRIGQLFIGMVMLCLSVLLILEGQKAYPVIIVIYSLALEALGLRMIWYYFRMARHMVGGTNILFRGILSFDFGMFAGSLVLVPSLYILAYLSATMAFSGLVDLLRGREARRIQGPFKLKTFTGVVKTVTALSCLIFMRTPALVVDIFSVGMVFSAVMRIVNAFRRTPVILIDSQEE